MADRLDKLRATLSELDAELRAIDSLDDATREQLASAAAEIAASLRRGKRSEETRRAGGSRQKRGVGVGGAYPPPPGIVPRLLHGRRPPGVSPRHPARSAV